jgi:hypothetical protein|tara:strand:+ start:484 stop:738 length:255 start_codon:yes stop_codon:yes gene_type:complete
MSGAEKDNNSIMEIDGRLTTHEAICAERWKTVFNQLEGIEKRSGKRFDDVGESITRLETILISAAAAGLLAACGLIATHLGMMS